MNKTLFSKIVSTSCLIITLVLGAPLASFGETSATSLPTPSTTKPDTTQIQKALAQAGYYQGTIDGVIGPKTRRAIRAFQEANGLKADGRCGPLTWEKQKVYVIEAIDSSAGGSGATVSGDASLVSEAASVSNPPQNAAEDSDLKQKLVY